MPTSLSNPQSLAQNELQQALDYCAQEQWQQAINCCAKALQKLSLVPGNESSLPPAVATRSYLEQAETFWAEGNLASALDAYLKVLATQPDWGKIYAQVGTIYGQQKNWHLAQKYSQQALKLNHKLPEAYRNLALVMQQEGNLSAAAQSWYRALQLEPAWAQVKDYLSLGKTLQQQGNLSQAEDCYRCALTLEPDGGEIYYHLGYLLRIQGKQDEAMDCYHQADKLGFNTALLNFHWAEALADKFQFNQAVAKYRQAIKLKPDFWQAHHQLGNVLLHQEKLPPAIKAFRHAIELEPQVAWSHHHLGMALAKQGKLALAIAAYDRAIEVEPNSVASYIKLANIYSHQGNLDLEVDSYLKAIEIQPNFKQAHERLRYNLLRYEIKNDSPLIDKIIATCKGIIAKETDSIALYITLGYALTEKEKLHEAISYYQRGSQQLGKAILPHVSDSDWETAQRKPPQFIVIGAEKCGTTSLYHYLSQHPQLLLPVEKELDFFDLKFQLGIDWYLAHFTPIPTQEENLITGEVSPNYLYCQTALQRIKELFPKVKLIVLLRNPVDRTVSRYYMLHKKVYSGSSLEEKINSEIQQITNNMDNGEISWQILNRYRNLGNSLYFFHLKRWLEIFPREQLLVVKSEDFYQNSGVALQNIFEYLEVPNHELAEYKKHNAGSYNPITEEMRNKLVEFFKPHNQKLEDLLGIEFNW